MTRRLDNLLLPKENSNKKKLQLGNDVGGDAALKAGERLFTNWKKWKVQKKKMRDEKKADNGPGTALSAPQE